MSFPFDTLRMFCVLAEKRNYTTAAEALNISQPTLSRRIQQLEDTTGMALVHRGQTVELTRQGKEFLDYCHRTTRDWEKMLSIIHYDEQELRGEVTIGLLHPMARIMSQGFLQRFKRQHPNIHVSLKTMHPVHLHKMQDCDLMVSPFLPDDQRLVAKPMLYYERVFCASPDYLKRHGTPQTPHELKGHACITHTNSATTEPRWEWQNREGKQDSVKIKSVMASDSIDISINLAVSGIGIAYLPSRQIRHLVESGALVVLFEGNAYQEGQMYCIYKSRHHLPLRGRVFMKELSDFLQDTYATMPAFLA
ncbi:LysR family transcriptional regulator [Parendozoicomonas haliclonae]|uniref:HTH-type transcriptional regulator DmlR n=1 Tax=Parendozoicomonas haliclonae TaxID=1960125 RepID=A0A1X7ARJ6_9GAMM|nr:LysR family transcriptional regulator [Parendozoicomonas haliclonae]SMA50762.1 HTH-type transcriptional regulator DmlR [Parendozoicomonas haliclonae]